MGTTCKLCLFFRLKHTRMHHGGHEIMRKWYDSQEDHHAPYEYNNANPTGVSKQSFAKSRSPARRESLKQKTFRLGRSSICHVLQHLSANTANSVFVAFGLERERQAKNRDPQFALEHIRVLDKTTNSPSEKSSNPTRLLTQHSTKSP